MSCEPMQQPHPDLMRQRHLRPLLETLDRAGLRPDNHWVAACGCHCWLYYDAHAQADRFMETIDAFDNDRIDVTGYEEAPMSITVEEVFGLITGGEVDSDSWPVAIHAAIIDLPELDKRVREALDVDARGAAAPPAGWGSPEYN